MTQINLLPCPFCGGDAEITRYGNNKVSTWYQCNDCGVSLETSETFNHGDAWNTRHTPKRELVVNRDAKQSRLDCEQMANDIDPRRSELLADRYSSKP